MLILLILVKVLSNFIVQRFAGGWLQDINTDALILFIAIESIVSILLILISKTVKTNIIKEEKVAINEK